MKTSVGHRRAQAGRAILMKAALGLFSRKGVEDTSVEEICLAAGYSKGGFYFHFDGKDDLLAQILDGTADLDDSRSYGPLAAELWALTAHNEAVRNRLFERYDRRRRSLLHAALVDGKSQTYASRLLDLLLLLDTGLRVQQRFGTSSADKAQDLLDELLAALLEPSTGIAQQDRRIAGAGL